MIPRRLTLEFLEAEPIRNRLLGAITGGDLLDQPEKGIEALHGKEEIFPRVRVESNLQIRDLWAELRKFAGSTWWISVAPVCAGRGGIGLSRPEALNPMRELLRREQHDLFLALQADAQILPTAGPKLAARLARAFRSPARGCLSRFPTPR